MGTGMTDSAPPVSQEDADKMAKLHEYFISGRLGGRRLNLTLAHAENLNFAGRNLAHAELPGAVLLGCNFTQTILRGANFFGADLRYCNLRQADLTGADIRGAILRGANFEGAIMVQSDMREGHILKKNDNGELTKPRPGGQTTITDVNFTRANFTGARLDASLSNKTDFSFVSFKNARMNEADLSHSNLRGAHFGGADLTNSNLTGAILQGAVLRGANLAGALLDEADLSTAMLDPHDLAKANLGKAKLPSVFENMDFQLQQILKDHFAWLESIGRAGKQADLANTQLGGLTLHDVDLLAAVPT